MMRRVDDDDRYGLAFGSVHRYGKKEVPAPNDGQCGSDGGREKIVVFPYRE